MPSSHQGYYWGKEYSLFIGYLYIFQLFNIYCRLYFSTSNVFSWVASMHIVMSKSKLCVIYMESRVVLWGKAACSKVPCHSVSVRYLLSCAFEYFCNAIFCCFKIYSFRLELTHRLQRMEGICSNGIFNMNTNYQLK